MRPRPSIIGCTAIRRKRISPTSPPTATRANFDPKSVDEDTLERIKLEDGIHYHEHVKVQLATYAKQNEVRTVHPFMLVVTQDTDHARRVREFVESETFFDGRYKGRVAEIHSKLTGEESDENAQRLLNIEKSGDTDIVRGRLTAPTSWSRPRPSA